jgi:starch synthase (maltosyl-transferring)
LGCEVEDIIELSKTGFDFTFNSSKWWDFKELWCLKQYAECAPYAPSVSFSESHDTSRLAHEFQGNIATIKLSYVFSALFSTAVLMPIGFEFCFQKRMNVVKTTPEDWESSMVDLGDFIRKANQIKLSARVFLEEGPIVQISQPNPEIFILHKSTRDGKQRALIIMNLDKQWYQGVTIDLEALLSAPASEISDISPEHALGTAPQILDYLLRANQVMVWVAGE